MGEHLGGQCWAENTVDGRLRPPRSWRFALPVTIALTALLLIPDASAAACPNEQFRTGYGAQLPDCRAYEQSTPVDKNGNNVGPLVDNVQAAEQGGAITVFSVGGITGGTGAQNFPLFLSSRGSSQWSTQGLFPPASFGPEAGVIGWNPDLASAFVFARQFGGGPALFLRDSSTGSLETIVPYTEGVGDYFFAGATEGSSEAIFETSGPAQLLPGATAGGSNVYLWDRGSGDLHLAGVLNDGSAPPEGAVAGPYDWFSESSAKTEQGGSRLQYYTQDANAISDDGSRVFFTATGEAQIYLRENPTRLQSPLSGGVCTDPALACTTQISASQKTNGSGPGGTDPNGPLPAAFVGATPDGAKAFFTSSEELTNDATTEPPPPSIGRADIDGTDTDLSFIPVTADGLAIDGTHVYWADPSTNSIGRALLDGTGIEEEFIAGASTPTGVDVDGTHIYWTNAGTGANGAGTIGRAKLDGTEINQAFIAGANNPQGVAVDGTHIYWANAGSTAATRKVGRAKLDGTEVNQEFISVASALNPGGVAVDGAHIYWSRPNGSAIGRAKLDGTEVNQEFITGAGEPQGLAVVGTHLYWAAASANGVGRAKLDGTEVDPSFVSVPGGKNPQGVAVNATHIYFSRPNAVSAGNDLYRYDVGSGDLTDITVDGGATPSGANVVGVLGIDGDGTHVYFAANGVLAPGASPGNCTNGDQGVGAGGACNLYLWNEGVITFIGPVDSTGGLFAGDVANWQPKTNVTPAEKAARVSADGETLLFRSQLSLTSYDSEGVPQFYRYDAAGDELLCVSCNPTGAPPTGTPRLQADIGLIGTGDQAAIQTRNLSGDGTRVFFDSPDALLESDTNGVGDVYEWEAVGTGSCAAAAQNGGCLYLLSTGRGSEPSHFADASASGEDASFFTSESLVGQDRDGGVIDIYDARVNGGLAAQNPISEPPCTGDACKGAGPVPAGPPTPASSIFRGRGNVNAGRDCSKPSRRAAQLRRRARGAASPQRAGRLRKQSRRVAQSAKRCRANQGRGAVK